MVACLYAAVAVPMHCLRMRDLHSMVCDGYMTKSKESGNQKNQKS